MANYDAKSLDVTANVGYIVVGDAKAPEVETKKGAGLTLTPGVVSGKAGETVKMVVNMENNPGFVGFDLQFNYDSNAMDIVSGSILIYSCPAVFHYGVRRSESAQTVICL